MTSPAFSVVFRNKLIQAFKKVEVSGETSIEFNRSTAIYLIGNGGSCAVAQHIAVDLVKHGHHAFALSDSSIMSMAANDYTWLEVFSLQVGVHAGGNDWLIAISSSGKSGNILEACKVAKNRNVNIMTLSGFEPDNPLRQMGDINYYVPSKNYGIVEITHLAILHSIVNPGL